MIHRDYSHGYALALLALAQEDKQLVTYKKDAQDIIEALRANHKFLTLLSLKSISIKVKEQITKVAFSKVNSNIQNLVLILSIKAKVKILEKVLLKLITYINQELNVKEGIIYSINKLSLRQIVAIEKFISKTIGTRCELKNLIDKSLILGIKVVVGDNVIEDTILSRLEQIKNQLMGGDA